MRGVFREWGPKFSEAQVGLQAEVLETPLHRPAPGVAVPESHGQRPVPRPVGGIRWGRGWGELGGSLGVGFILRGEGGLKGRGLGEGWRGSLSRLPGAQPLLDGLWGSYDTSGKVVRGGGGLDMLSVFLDCPFVSELFMKLQDGTVGVDGLACLVHGSEQLFKNNQTLGRKQAVQT